MNMESAMLKAPEGKWLVQCSTHRGSKATLEVWDDIVRDTLEGVHAAFREMCDRFIPYGYVIWYAYLYDDQGNQAQLARHHPFDR